MSILSHLLAILLLPGTATIVIPIILLNQTGMTIGWSLPPPLSFVSSALGIVAIGIGLTLMVKTISLFATVGKGTFAPWTPPQKLVVPGLSSKIFPRRAENIQRHRFLHRRRLVRRVRR